MSVPSAVIAQYCKLQQEYVKELEELLAVAKHPKVVALLKDAIKRGDAGTVTEPLIQKPVSVSKPSGDIATSNSTRITQYGMYM